MMFCPQCGGKAIAGARFCVLCGTRLPERASLPEVPQESLLDSPQDVLPVELPAVPVFPVVNESEKPLFLLDKNVQKAVGAGAESRNLAALIDGAFCMLVVYTIGGFEELPVFLGLVLLCQCGYGALAESSRWQSTLGGWWLRLVVVDARGNPLSLSCAAQRNFLRSLLFLTGIGGVVMLVQLLLFRRTWYDAVAGSFVLRRPLRTL